MLPAACTAKDALTHICAEAEAYLLSQHPRGCQPIARALSQPHLSLVQKGNGRSAEPDEAGSQAKQAARTLIMFHD
uniref:Uncharacterized protein n=1 Tax=Thermogemmatispora argillosa TaxID=2045280 RepID=A0A455T775_9CHLR|nr:hypothetical protein KTA_34740 [Thermogemmatispora argillosa]